MGRHRRYASDADRQRAYRERVRARGGGVRVRELESEVGELRMLLGEQRDRARRLEVENGRLKAGIEGRAGGGSKERVRVDKREA
jgi:hypothetical protein